MKPLEVTAETGLVSVRARVEEFGARADAMLRTLEDLAAEE